MNRRTRRNLRFIETPPDATTGAGPATPRTFTQEEVNAIAAREKAQGAASAQTAAQEALTARLTAAGLTDIDVDAAIALAASAKTTADAAKTETERLLAAAQTSLTAAETAKGEALAQLHTARLTAALTAAGAQNVAVATRAIVVAAGADEATLAAAVTALKTDAPGLFTAGVVVPHFDGGTGPAGGVGTGQAAGTAGLSEAERRFGKK